MPCRMQGFSSAVMPPVFPSSTVHRNYTSSSFWEQFPTPSTSAIRKFSLGFNLNFSTWSHSFSQRPPSPQKAPSCRRAFQLLLLQGSPSQLASGSRPLYPPEVGVCEFLRANCEDVKLSPLRKRSLALLHFVLAGGSSALNFNLSREDRIASGWPIFSSSAGTSTALLSPSEDGDVSWR